MSRGLRRPRKATVFYFAPPNGEQVVTVVISLASCSLLLLGTLVLLIREGRLGRARQRRIDCSPCGEACMSKTARAPTILSVPMFITLIGIGCSSRDDRSVELSRQTADR